jgi:hypothetical protein
MRPDATASGVEDQYTGLEIADDQVDRIEFVSDLIRYIESAWPDLRIKLRSVSLSHCSRNIRALL